MTWLRACESANSCVEVLNDGDRVLVRSTLNRERVTEFTREEWLVFLDGVKKGEFDPD